MLSTNEASTMRMIRARYFPHRLNLEQGGYDSICLVCFQTVVAGVHKEEELAIHEAAHLCPPSKLAEAQRRRLRFFHTQ